MSLHPHGSEMSDGAEAYVTGSAASDETGGSPDIEQSPGLSRQTPRRTGPKPGRLAKAWEVGGPPFIVVLIVLALWQFLPPRLGIPPFILPTLTYMWAEVVDHQEQFTSAVIVSGVTAAIAFILSGLLGILWALIMVRWDLVRRIVYPYAIMFHSVPVIAFAPLIIIWFGVGHFSILLIAVIVGFFPVVANTVVGLQSASSSSVDLFKVYGASTRQTLWKLRLPSALPFIMAGLRISASLAVIGTIIGEYVAGTSAGSGGLGYIIISAARNLQIGYVFAAAIVSALLGIAYFGLVVLAARYVLGPWHESAQARR